MFRFLYLNTFIAIYTVIICIITILWLLFNLKGDKPVFSTMSGAWARTIFRVCGVRVRTKGLGSVGACAPRIYMCNHQSYFDILALLAYLPTEFRFVLKQELMSIPLFGYTLRKTGNIGIKRDDPRKAVKSMKHAAEMIKNGTSLVIFPEGTRSRDGSLLPFRRGGFNLAFRSGCDIVPVAVSDSYRIIPKGSLKINRGSFTLNFGESISLDGYTRKNIEQLMDRVRDEILRKMHESGEDEDDQDDPKGRRHGGK